MIGYNPYNYNTCWFGINHNPYYKNNNRQYNRNLTHSEYNNYNNNDNHLQKITNF